MMNFEEIRQILEMVREHELTEFELEREGFKIRIRKNGGGQVLPLAPAAAPLAASPSAAAPPAVAASVAAPSPQRNATEPTGDEAAEIELAVVKSPIVGTFYRASEPGAAPFVGIGDQVRKGQVLCIIEAMKLMNEIESEYEGEVVNIFVENAQPVQYGERLFAIRVR